MAWVEVVGVQGMVKAPEVQDALHCYPRGSWTEACTYVSEGQGGPWWCWMTGCSYLARTGLEERVEAEAMRPVSQKGRLGRSY